VNPKPVYLFPGRHEKGAPPGPHSCNKLLGRYLIARSFSVLPFYLAGRFQRSFIYSTIAVIIYTTNSHRISETITVRIIIKSQTFGRSFEYAGFVTLASVGPT
jgi:hypothetical protein